MGQGNSKTASALGGDVSLQAVDLDSLGLPDDIRLIAQGMLDELVAMDEATARKEDEAARIKQSLPALEAACAKAREEVHVRANENWVTRRTREEELQTMDADVLDMRLQVVRTRGEAARLRAETARTKARGEELDAWEDVVLNLLDGCNRAMEATPNDVQVPAPESVDALYKAARDELANIAASGREIGSLGARMQDVRTAVLEDNVRGVHLAEESVQALRDQQAAVQAALDTSHQVLCNRVAALAETRDALRDQWVGLARKHLGSEHLVDEMRVPVLFTNGKEIVREVHELMEEEEALRSEKSRSDALLDASEELCAVVRDAAAQVDGALKQMEATGVVSIVRRKKRSVRFNLKRNQVLIIGKGDNAAPMRAPGPNLAELIE